MNVEKNFFLHGVAAAAKATVKNTVGSSSVPIRIFWLGILIFIIIGLAFGLWWLAQQCTGYNAMHFEHFADASGATKTDVSGSKPPPPPQNLGEYLQSFILKNATDTKNALIKASDSLDNAMDGLDDAKENICGVLEDIQSNFVSSRLSGVDPSLANEPKDVQEKKLASRQARAKKDWERRKKVWTERHHEPLLECFYDASGAKKPKKTDSSEPVGDLSGSVDTVTLAISQISFVCDDINDILSNLQEQIQSQEIQNVVHMFFSIHGSINFATPFIQNSAMVVSNGASTIRNMPKPDVSTTAVKPTEEPAPTAATTEPATAAPAAPAAPVTKEGFDNMSDALQKFNSQFNMLYPDISKKYTTSTSQAAGITGQIGQFLMMVAALQKNAKEASDTNKKIKKTQKNLKDGKITPAYMDDKPK